MYYYIIIIIIIIKKKIKKKKEEEEEEKKNTEEQTIIEAMKQHQFLVLDGIFTDFNYRLNRGVDSSRWAHGRQGNYPSLFLESIGGS